MSLIDSQPPPQSAVAVHSLTIVSPLFQHKKNTCAHTTKFSGRGKHYSCNFLVLNKTSQSFIFLHTPITIIIRPATSVLTDVLTTIKKIIYAAQLCTRIKAQWLLLLPFPFHILLTIKYIFKRKILLLHTLQFSYLCAHIFL